MGIGLAGLGIASAILFLMRSSSDDRVKARKEPCPEAETGLEADDDFEQGPQRQPCC